METKLIKVIKTASKKVPADVVEITVRASGEAKTARDAAVKADIAADAIIGKLKTAGYDGVRAERISVSAKRVERKVVGYSAVRTFTVKFGYDGEKLGMALELLADGACEFGVSFKLEDRSASEDLIAQAVKCARSDAETIARAAGVKLGALFAAEYRSQEYDGAVPMMLCARGADGYAGEANSVRPEDISLSETVECSWEIA